VDNKDNLSEHIKMFKEPMLQGRQNERYSVDFMDIHGKILFNSNVKILNISAGGVSFSTDKSLKIRGTYILRLESKGITLHLRGIVIWTILNEITQGNKNKTQTYNVGMKFSNASVTREKGIKQFIQDNFKDQQESKISSSVINDARIHVRFRIYEPDKAMIHCAEHYKLKRITKSGILIESDTIMPIGNILPLEIALLENIPINLWGRVVTCQAIKDTKPPRYKISIELIDMKTCVTSIEK
jgi:hypothetical protein